MADIAVYGAGGFGKEISALLQNLLRSGTIGGNFIGFYDDSAPSISLKFPYLGSYQDCNARVSDLYLIIAVGHSVVRRSMRQKIKNPFVKFPTIVSSNALLEDPQNIAIDEGSILCSGIILTTDISIGKFCVVNINATIGHDVTLGDYVSIMPSVNISGGVSIGEGSFIGSGATILQNITIGNNVMVGAGAVVTRNIPDGSTVVGIPARKLR
jgi:sugar O-acyltransferase (sialic acid O-acetyltransferase NeuD family)